MVWLIINEQGIILATVADPILANLIGLALGTKVERARNGIYKLGDTLPVFHE